MADDSRYYVLMGKLAVPEPDLMKWGRWYESADRQVAVTVIGPIKVSTVFLGLDHSHGRELLPILFETLVYRGGDGQEMYRYASWQEAEAGHARAVAEVRAEIIAKAQS